MTCSVFAALPDLDETLLDLLDAVGKGYALCEIMWAVDGNRARVTGFEPIHAKRAVFYQMSGGPWDPLVKVPSIITARNEIEGEQLPPFKLIYHRYKARSGYDTRAGVLRVCAWMYLFKNYALKDWVTFAEVFGMPLRLGKFDPAASEADKDALIAAITSLGSDAAGIISKNTEIEFVETVKNSGSTNNVYAELAGFCNKEISKAVLGQTLTSQEGQSGSYALGQVHELVRHDLLEADARALGKTITFQVVRPLVGYNFGWDQSLPRFILPCEQPDDLKALSEVYKNLSEINYPLTVEHVAERFKVPAPQQGQTVLAPKNAAAGAPITAKKGVPAAPGAKFSPEQQKVEGLVAQTLDRANLVLSGVLAPVRRMVAAADSIEQLRDDIYAAYADMEPAALEDLIAQALFAAELYGRLTIERG